MKSPFRPRPTAITPHRPILSARKSPLAAVVFATPTLALTLVLTLVLAALGGCKKSAPDPTKAGTDEPTPVLFRSTIGDLVALSSNTRTAAADTPSPTNTRAAADALPPTEPQTPQPGARPSCKTSMALTSNSLKTRTSSTGSVSMAWDDGDAIGVFMIPHGGALTDGETVRNALYTHTGGGNFRAMDGGGVVYPRIGSVDFVAYYPWRTTFGSHTLAIDVGGVCDPATMDLLYSDNAVECASGDTPTLRFHHRLAKLAFTVTDATGASLKELGATINGPATRGTFDLAAGRIAVDGGSSDEIVAAWRDDGDATDATARLEAIVVPGGTAATTVDFAPGDGTTARLVLPASEWLAGSVYTYRVRITEAREVVFAGDTEIVDWNEQNDDSTEHNIEKQRPDDDAPDSSGGGGNPTDPDDGAPGSGDDDPNDDDDGDDAPGDGGGGGGDPTDPDDGTPGDGGGDPTDPVKPTEPGKAGAYFVEGFGTYTGSEGVAISDYKGWNNAMVSFSDAFRDMSGIGGAQVSYSEALGTHIEFPPGANADFKIDNLPANRSDITLSYDIASSKGAAWANNLIKVYANDNILTKSVTTEITSPNEYVRIIIKIPDGGGVKSLRFAVDGESNDGGMHLDNIRLEGKPPAAKTK